MGRIVWNWSARRADEESRLLECPCGAVYDPLFCDDDERLLCDDCYCKMMDEQYFRIREDA